MRRLKCHPDKPGPPIQIDVGIASSPGGSVTFRYEVRGALDAVKWPEPSRKGPGHRDELWKATCFEAFFRVGDQEAYRELNFSPSGDWAAYAFSRYRTKVLKRREHVNIGQGLIVAVMPFDDMIVIEGLTTDRATVGRATAFGLSAVIEETDGSKSYWALRHPSGPPDFHHPDCFALELPALGAS